jgi:hypothetical protein
MAPGSCVVISVLLLLAVRAVCADQIGCTEVPAARAVVAGVAVPGCPARGAGHTVRRAPKLVAHLLARAARRCRRGRTAAAATDIDKAIRVVDAAANALETAATLGRVTTQCASASRAMLDALSAALLSSAGATTTSSTTSTTTTTLPLTADQKFVRQLFRVELGRDGIPAEWAPLVSALAGGTVRSDVVTTVQTSAEAFARVVTDLYETRLGRAPSAMENALWVTALQSGTTDVDVLVAILIGPEYYSHAPDVTGVGGSPSDATLVAAVYQQLLARAPTSIELANGVALVGTSPSTFVQAVVAVGGEWRTRVVHDVYVELLGRAPSPAETSFLLAAGTGPRGTRFAVETTPEFFSYASGQP